MKRRLQQDPDWVRADQLDTTRDAIFDVRLRPGEQKITGARLYAPGTLLSLDMLDGIPIAARIAIYSDSEAISLAVLVHLRRLGYRNAALLAGGFEVWRDLNMPLEDVLPVVSSNGG